MTSLLALLLLTGCGGPPDDGATEIGNPELTVALRSSAPAWIGTEPHAARSLDDAWIHVEELVVEDCEGGREVAAGGWLDLLSPAPVVLNARGERWCGLELTLGPAALPEGEGTASAWVNGSERFGRRFELHTEAVSTVAFGVDDLVVEDWRIEVDVASWLVGADLTGVGSTDAVVRASLEGQVQDGAALWNTSGEPLVGEAAPVLDTDQDGLPDDEESSLGGDPLVADSDADGVLDGEEVYSFATEVDDPDSDGDGFDDGTELNAGYDPTEQNIDNDGDGFLPPEDCNDTDPGVFPGAAELPDGIDNDCNGIIDG